MIACSCVRVRGSCFSVLTFDFCFSLSVVDCYQYINQSCYVCTAAYARAVVKYAEKTPRERPREPIPPSGQYLHLPVMEMITVSHDDDDVMCSHGVEDDAGDGFF